MATATDPTSQIAELQREVGELRGELASLRSEQQRPRHEDPEVFARGLRQFIEMTNELIPGDVRVENSIDPEYPETVCVVFHVTAENKPNDVNALIAMEVEWHRRARAILPGATCHFCISID